MKTPAFAFDQQPEPEEIAMENPITALSTAAAIFCGFALADIRELADGAVVEMSLPAPAGLPRC